MDRYQLASDDLAQFFADLKTELGKLPVRPPKGELLRRAYEIPLVWPEAEYPPERSMPEQFSQALANWGGEVEIVDDEAAAIAHVRSIVKAAEAKKISRWKTNRLDPLNLEEALAGLDLEWIDISPDEVAAAGDYPARKKIIDRLEQIDVGIIDCDLAVAHTGTLLLPHTADRNGLTNLLPWTCIAVVWHSQMVRTVEDLGDYLKDRPKEEVWGPNTAWVTGPSRSGDIDLTVGQGAAGPGRWHVVVIDDKK